MTLARGDADNYKTQQAGVFFFLINNTYADDVGQHFRLLSKIVMSFVPANRSYVLKCSCVCGGTYS